MTLSLPHVGSGQETCPYCSGHHIVRKGQRKKKLETIQLWRCNDCNKVFTPQPLRGKSFPLPVILQAVTLYNQGYSPDAVCRLMTERSGLPFAPSTLSSWVSEHQGLCAYSRLRDAGRELFGPQQIIRSVKLYHQQVYEFSIHKTKLQLLTGSADAPASRFGPLREFLELMMRRCPHELFATTTRASSAKKHH